MVSELCLLEFPVEISRVVHRGQARLISTGNSRRHSSDTIHRRPEPEQSCRRTASRMLAQDVLRPFFADLADSIIDYARWQRPPGTGDKKPVFPNHATALRTCRIFQLER